MHFRIVTFRQSKIDQNNTFHTSLWIHINYGISLVEVHVNNLFHLQEFQYSQSLPNVILHWFNERIHLSVGKHVESIRTILVHELSKSVAFGLLHFQEGNLLSTIVDKSEMTLSRENGFNKVSLNKMIVLTWFVHVNYCRNFIFVLGTTENVTLITRTSNFLTWIHTLVQFPNPSLRIDANQAWWFLRPLVLA